MQKRTKKLAGLLCFLSAVIVFAGCDKDKKVKTSGDFKKYTKKFDE